jgi:hypothetical protein
MDVFTRLNVLDNCNFDKINDKSFDEITHYPCSALLRCNLFRSALFFKQRQSARGSDRSRSPAAMHFSFCLEVHVYTCIHIYYCFISL